MHHANPHISNVPDAVDRISQQSRTVQIEAGHLNLPLGGHLQGIQRSYVTRGRAATMVLSGSSDSESYCLWARVPLPLDSGGPSSLTCPQKPETGGDTETSVHYQKLCDAPFRHAGGIQVIGQYLTVGVEDNSNRDQSKVLFYDISDPVSPQQLPHLTIERSGTGLTAGAVGIVRRSSGHLLLVGRWDSSVLDLYISNGKPLHDLDCRFSPSHIWDSSDADRSDWTPDPVWGSHQSLNLVSDVTGNLYLLGFNRNAEGIDCLDLFRLDTTQRTPKMIQKLSSRPMYCPPGRGFRHGAGIFIMPNGLSAYACEKDTHDRITINEF